MPTHHQVLCVFILVIYKISDCFSSTLEKDNGVNDKNIIVLNNILSGKKVLMANISNSSHSNPTTMVRAFENNTEQNELEEDIIIGNEMDFEGTQKRIRRETSGHWKEIVAHHNTYRLKHGVPPLVYNETISVKSKEWAARLAKEDRLYHSSQTKYGENLFKLSNRGKPLNSLFPVDSWYNESKKYQYGKENNYKIIGHFTQLIWKNTKAIGVGVSQSKDKSWYVVCNYWPPGNVKGMYDVNVLKPKTQDRGHGTSVTAHSRFLCKKMGHYQKRVTTTTTCSPRNKKIHVKDVLKYQKSKMAVKIKIVIKENGSQNES